MPADPQATDRVDEEVEVARRHLHIALGAVCMLPESADAASHIKAALQVLPRLRAENGRLRAALCGVSDG